MVVFFSIAALAVLVFGLVNLVRPSGFLGVVSRRRALWWAFAFVLLVVAAAQGLSERSDGRGPFGSEPGPPTATTFKAGSDSVFSPPADGPSGDPAAAMMVEAEIVRVARVIDGDTIEVEMGGGRERVRLIGLDAPEVGECWAAEADRVLSALTPVGSVIGMTVDESDRDQFGRLLRYLWVGSMSVNEELVRRGAAISRRYLPDTAMAGRLEAAQSYARAVGRGVWARDPCAAEREGVLGIDEVD